MNFHFSSTRFHALWYPGLAALMLLLLPMGAINTVVQAATATDAPAKIPAWVVSTSPTIAATDVDPDLKEITITFDRDMSGGMSWTGESVPSDPDKQAYWKDKRTCVLPIELEKGEYYRVGVNSTSYRNFKSAGGEPAPCTAIYFATKGASKAVAGRVRVPKIVKLVPENGATEVDPIKTKTLRVTFDIPMGGGMSWTGSDVPATEPGKWSGDGKTCVLPVSLVPGHQYEMGLNSLHHVNFQSRWGVPLEPVLYKFTTKGE